LGTNQALEAARALALNPSLAPLMRQANLPADISTLLRFLAGDLPASVFTQGDAGKLMDVVERYVIAVMLYPGAAPSRILGVTNGAPRDQARAHMRLLMIWLHPDRAGDTWRAPYSVRVLEAWRHISSAPANIRPADVASAQVHRPRTRPVRLAWVARPVVKKRRRNTMAALAGPALVALALLAIAVFNNPLRQLAQAAFASYASDISWSGRAPGS
jgi:hypothetical protein